MRTWVRRAVLGLAAVLVLCGAWTALELVQVRADASAARDLLEQAADAKDLRAAASGLQQAEELFRSAEDRLRRPGPAVVAALPLVGRPLDAARSTAAAAEAVARGGVRVLESVPERLLVAGRLDLAGAGEVETALRAAAEESQGPVARLMDVRLSGVPGAVADPVSEAQARLHDVPEILRRAADGLAVVQGVFGAERPRRLLVVLQNNAELRATGGLVSVFTQATAREGSLRLERFQEVDAVADPPAQAEPVPAPEDYRRLYGPYLADTTLWKNVNMSPDVPTSSSVLAEVAEATLTASPDVIVWVDVPAIAALLRATGPVTLPDGSVLTADNVVERLLSDAYAEADQSGGDQDRRQDELRAAADAVLGQLLGPQPDAPSGRLARELVEAAMGRHLALWSSDPQEQAQIASARLAGQVRAEDGDLVSVAVHNLGGGGGEGNKLDLYSRRQLSVRVEVGPEHALVEQELALRNAAPEQGLPLYVAGRDLPGTTNNLVSFSLPAGAQLEAFERNGRRLAAQPLPTLDHAVLQDVAGIGPGETVTWRLRYRLDLAQARYTSQLFPQPLAVEAGLLLEVRPVAGRQLEGGPVVVSGPHDQVTRIDTRLRPRSSWSRAVDAVRRFWNEPVRLP